MPLFFNPDYISPAAQKLIEKNKQLKQERDAFTDADLLQQRKEDKRLIARTQNLVLLKHNSDVLKSKEKTENERAERLNPQSNVSTVDLIAKNKEIMGCLQRKNKGLFPI
jgi:hypothetical protein